MEQWGDRCNQVFVRVAKGQDKVEAKRRIADVLNRLDASQKYEMNFLDNDLQQTYVEEFRFISQVKFFAIICIIITVIGVFSLTMFETEYRRKEIGIRKVMGSSVGSIVRLFAMRYTVPLVVSFAVAAPGWLVAQHAVAAELRRAHAAPLVALPAQLRRCLCRCHCDGCGAVVARSDAESGRKHQDRVMPP